MLQSTYAPAQQTKLFFTRPVPRPAQKQFIPTIREQLIQYQVCEQIDALSVRIRDVSEKMREKTDNFRDILQNSTKYERIRCQFTLQELLARQKKLERDAETEHTQYMEMDKAARDARTQLHSIQIDVENVKQRLNSEANKQ